MRISILLLILTIFSFKAYSDEDITTGDRFRHNERPLIGFTYTQDKIYIARAQGSDVANIPIYGWGSLWPFPEGGEREHDNGESIAQRITQAQAGGQDIVLTCATAPSDYRQSRQPWNMNERVEESMEQKYAQRCAEAVQRWPQIRRVQVWNELKGYWDVSKNEWDYVAYTRFYNKVYSAVKAVRTDVMVGGGYAVVTPNASHFFDKTYNGVLADSRAITALLYWAEHAKGYDAICLDGNMGPDDFVKLTVYFRQVVHDKPVWWAEYYGANVEQMRATRKALSHALRPGDMALWWASTKFPW